MRTVMTTLLQHVITLQLRHLVQLSSEDYDDASTRAAAMSASTKVVAALCTVTQQDLMTLDGDAWVNDTVMYSYLSRGEDSTQVGEIYVLPSFLAVRWQSGQYSTVELLYSKVKIRRFRWLLLPLHVNGNHWALLIADVQALTVGVADSLPTSSSLKYIVHFKRYVAARVEMTDELVAWTDVEYTIQRQNDGTICGVLARMAAEAAAQGQPLSTVDPGSVSFYRR